PCSTSATTIPVNANGSACAIIRPNASPARPGLALKKSTHTELSTRINRDSSASPSNPPSRSRSHSASESPSGSQTAPATPAPCPQSPASSSAVSASAPSSPILHQSQYLFCPYPQHTPFPHNLVYMSAHGVTARRQWQTGRPVYEPRKPANRL